MLKYACEFESHASHYTLLGGEIGRRGRFKIYSPKGLWVRVPSGPQLHNASLVQLVEPLFCNQYVAGSSPVGSS